ncbi:MAG: tyrosine-type recombinase/integrase [Pseudonocardiaceae bacterium]
MGRRDFAILTAMARLGLRAGEVAALRLDDVDWRAGELVVRGKGNHLDRLPLPADVGEAVVDCLRHGRARSACDERACSIGPGLPGDAPRRRLRAAPSKAACWPTSSATASAGW